MFVDLLPCDLSASLLGACSGALQISSLGVENVRVGFAGYAFSLRLRVSGTPSP